MREIIVSVGMVNGDKEFRFQDDGYDVRLVDEGFRISKLNKKNRNEYEYQLIIPMNKLNYCEFKETENGGNDD